MRPAKIAAIVLLIGWVFLTATALTGCETLRLGLATDYGTFSYELPKPVSSK